MKRRTIEIIQLLIRTAEVMTIQEIAEKLEVSPKTIRNDLKKVEKLLAGTKVSLIRRTGVGIFLVGKESDKFHLYNRFASFHNVHGDDTSHDRHQYILHQLITGRGELTVTSLQEDLFVSRSLIYKDMEKVRAWLSIRGIQLSSGKEKNLSLEAGEKRIRKAAADLFFQSKAFDRVVDFDENAEGECVYGKLNYFSYGQAVDFIEIEQTRLDELIGRFEKTLHVRFVASDRMKLMVRIGIAMTRLKMGRQVTLLPETYLELEKLSVFDHLDSFNEFIQMQLGFVLSKEEWAYLLGLAIASETDQGSPGWNVGQKSDVVTRIVAHEIVDLVTNSFSIEDLASFRSDVMHYLQVTFNKFLYDENFETVDGSLIKASYPHAYELAEKCRQIFEDVINRSLPDTEVGKIAMIIAVAIEKSKRPLRAIFVYHQNYAEAMLAKEILRNHFHQLELVKVIPTYLSEKVDMDQVDLVISSQGLSHVTAKKMLLISTVFLREELWRLSKLIQEQYERMNQERLFLSSTFLRN